jgi:hypothetical protein
VSALGRVVPILGAAALCGGVVAAAPALPLPPEPEVIATGVPRPLQLALDGRHLIILSPGTAGDDVAGEIYRVDLAGPLPVDLARQPRVRIPYTDAHMASLGSLALDPATGALFLGEENGRRLYRLASDERLALYATGLRRLVGGSALAFDGLGRLLVLDYVDPTMSPGEDRGPPGLEDLERDDYRGPLVYALGLESNVPLPRRLDRLAPLFPRAWGGRRGGALLPRLISLATLPGGGLAVLSSAGQLFRLGSDGTLTSFARLPPGHGQYNRTNLAVAPDGIVFVSAGFHVGRIFRISPDGGVTTVAANLGDPEGLALDGAGDLYVAESSFHRIVRLKPSGP